MTEILLNPSEPQSDKESTTSLSTVPSRQKKHLWKPGQTGNPSGRPVGTKNKITQQKIGIEAQLRDQLGEYMPEVLQKAIEMALAGDRAMLKVLLEFNISKAVALEDSSEGKDRVQVTIRRLNIDTVQAAPGNIIDVTPAKIEENDE